MGAQTFFCDARARTAEHAFNLLREQAFYDYGHSGYSGTIAEKSEFVMIEVPKDTNPRDHAHELIDKDDPRISDKWGPAGCVKLGKGHFLFFGWASS